MALLFSFKIGNIIRYIIEFNWARYILTAKLQSNDLYISLCVLCVYIYYIYNTYIHFFC